MALDPYSLCPGGTGKKVKFCCPDLLAELEKIERMLSGDQRLACLDHIQQLETKYPGRACLLTTKAMLLSEMQRPDEADAALQIVLREQPANPVALAESALVAVARNDSTAAIDQLQAAIAASPNEIPAQVYTALIVIGQSLLAEGRVAAGRGHLMLAANLSASDKYPLSLLARISASSAVPLLLKEDPDLAECPADAPWKAEFDAALAPLLRGAWRVAADKLAELSDRAGDAPAVWRNLATLRTWLGDNVGAATALRQFAALDVPPDDAVEAEALAQLLDPAAQDRIDILSVEYAVRDMDQLITAFRSDRRLAESAVDPTPWMQDDVPPPKQAFTLLDRPMPATSVGMTRDAVPTGLAQAMVFGRETDREARLELVVNRVDLPRAQEALVDIARDALGAESAEEVIGSLAAEQHKFRTDWRFPSDITADLAFDLLVQQRRHTLLEVWPRTASAVLAGRTPEQAADEPDKRLALLADILNLELASGESSVGDLFDELRQRLGLPAATAIDPSGMAVDRIPLARLARLRLDRLSDDDLLVAHRRAAFAMAKTAARKISHEIAGRASMNDKLNKATIFEVLADLEDDSRQALSYLDKARAANRAKGRSCASVDLAELSLRLERGDAQDFARVMEHVQREHAREPGVAQALLQILVDAGLVGPDGRPAARPEESQAPALVVPGGATAEPGKIWTPGSEGPQGKKSALWTPGMD